MDTNNLIPNENIKFYAFFDTKGDKIIPEIKSARDLNLEATEVDLIYLDDLIYSIKSINEIDCQWEALQRFDDIKTRKQAIESKFSHELYYELKKTIDILKKAKELIIIKQDTLYTSIGRLEERFKTNVDRYSNIQLDTTAFKGIDNKNELIKFHSLPKKFKWKKGISPDLVMHGGQFIKDYQKLIIEIKTEINLKKHDLVQDLEKLLNFTNQFDFQFGVQIVVNQLPSIVAETIQSSYSIEIANEYSERFKKVIVLCYNNEVLYGTTLYDIVAS